MSWLGETDDYNKEDSLGEFNNDRYIEDLSEDNMDLNTNNNFIEEESEYANKDIKLKVPLPVILFLIAIIAISVFSMIRFPSTLQDYKIYKNAKERIRETYLIALHFNDLIEEAQVIKNEIIELQGQLEEETQKLLEGEITLEEYYVEG